MYVHKHTLDDEPRMRGILDRDMIDGVKMVEDEQLLYGDGVGDNILGLVNQPGIQAYIGLNTDKRSAQIRRAHPRHPRLLPADRCGPAPARLGEHGAGDRPQRRLHHRRVGRCRRREAGVADAGRRHPGDAAGPFLLGAFGTGAKVYDREQVRIDLSTENRDMFERNAYTLRAEERIGLVVDRPESFVYGTFTTPV
jgi:hypothetical protein